MLNLKQKLSSNGNELVPQLPRSLSCHHLLARLYSGCFLGFMRNNTGSLQAKRSNCDCCILLRSQFEIKKKSKKKKKKNRTKAEKVASQASPKMSFAPSHTVSSTVEPTPLSGNSCPTLHTAKTFPLKLLFPELKNKRSMGHDLLT